jgi:hypothetical protein
MIYGIPKAYTSVTMLENTDICQMRCLGKYGLAK